MRGESHEARPAPLPPTRELPTRSATFLVICVMVGLGGVTSRNLAIRRNCGFYLR